MKKTTPRGTLGWRRAAPCCRYHRRCAQRRSAHQGNFSSDVGPGQIGLAPCACLRRRI